MPRKGPQIVTESAIAKVAQEAEQSLVGLDPLPKRLRTLKMTSDESYQTLQEEARVVRDLERSVEKKQRSLTSMCDRLKKDIKDVFKPMLNACKEVLEIVSRKELEFDRWQTEQFEAERRRAEAEAEAEQKRLERNARKRAGRREDPREARAILQSVPQIEAAEPKPPVAPKVEGVSVAKIWDFEILDSEAVPRTVQVNGDPVELWERKYNRAALLKAREVYSEEPQPIPGVRFFQKPSTRYERL